MNYITFAEKTKEKEDVADRFAEDKLIPPEKYKHFIQTTNFLRKKLSENLQTVSKETLALCWGVCSMIKKCHFMMLICRER